MKITSSQYVLCAKEASEEDLLFVLISNRFFKQWENIQNSVICLQWDAQNKTSLVIDL